MGFNFRGSMKIPRISHENKLWQFIFENGNEFLLTLILFRYKKDGIFVTLKVSLGNEMQIYLTVPFFPQGKRKGWKKEINLRKSPFLLQDGDILGVKVIN